MTDRTVTLAHRSRTVGDDLHMAFNVAYGADGYDHSAVMLVCAALGIQETDLVANVFVLKPGQTVFEWMEIEDGEPSRRVAVRSAVAP